MALYGPLGRGLLNTLGAIQGGMGNPSLKWTFCCLTKPLSLILQYGLKESCLALLGFLSLSMSTRRDFIQQLGMGVSSLCLPWTLSSVSPSTSPLRFGIVADAHKDLVFDADRRLEAFIERAGQDSLDFIIQIGDFCMPKKENDDFLKIWRQFSGLRYHVLGNHDMDTSSKQETQDYWDMPEPYYSFDAGDYHFVVLDANFLYRDGKYIDYEKANFYVDASYRTFVHPQQIEWLEEDLKRNSKPTIVFSHQGLAHDLWGIKNRLAIQKVLESAHHDPESGPVIACFNGHNHLDFHRTINGIHYLDINSLSYHWLGSKYENKSRYSAKIYEAYPNTAYIIPYKDPLFAMIEVIPGELRIAGKQSGWVGPSPSATGVPPQIYGSEITPDISDRTIIY